MNSLAPEYLLSGDELSDEEIVTRVRQGDRALYELLMRRHNRSLYRVARSILRNSAEAEDVMQEAYVSAYQHLNQFAGKSKFSTWLIKIVVHESLARVRRKGRLTGLDSLTEGRLYIVSKQRAAAPDPECQTYDRELRLVIENALDEIPEIYRSVFVLRAVEGMDTAATAECLGLTLETAKTRFHRARSLLRKAIQRRAGLVAEELFPFHLSRCDSVVDAVNRRIAALEVER